SVPVTVEVTVHELKPNGSVKQTTREVEVWSDERGEIKLVEWNLKYEGNNEVLKVTYEVVDVGNLERFETWTPDGVVYTVANPRCVSRGCS
ncbi:MAG TPA: hypothetical protein VK866_18400, partial [Acidimicrobiales bacterium]|nr:hypothetical protein [Acidimicrobiales bacterium]